MKLEEWKRFLDSIPDNEYTRELDYTRFEDAIFVDAEELDARECFVTFNGEQIFPVRANAERGRADVFKYDSSGNPISNENENLETERIYGNIKIIKYEHK